MRLNIQLVSISLNREEGIALLNLLNKHIPIAPPGHDPDQDAARLRDLKKLLESSYDSSIKGVHYA